ncbi:MAG: hypothetical protein KIT74_08280 [Fimbriimonadales bacterium]|nr:hypothetical protein [Fimbriimonadales bacterium]
MPRRKKEEAPPVGTDGEVEVSNVSLEPQEVKPARKRRSATEEEATEVVKRKSASKRTKSKSDVEPSEDRVVATLPSPEEVSSAGSAIKVRFRAKGETQEEQKAQQVPKQRGQTRLSTKKEDSQVKRGRVKSTPVKQNPELQIKPKPRPFTPDLPPIAIPADAPRIARIADRPMIVIEKQVIPPFIFFGNPSDERRLETVLAEIEKAASAGVHLHSLMIEFPVDSQLAQDAFDLAAYLLARVVATDPDAKLMFRVVFAGAPGWEKKFANAAFRFEDGTLAEPSVCDPGFWGEAQRLLSAFVRGLLALEEGRRIIGIHLDRGEWFFADGWGYDTSRAAEESFRDWARWRYGNDNVALQAAWFDGKARFETLKIPEYGTVPLSGESFLRESRKERKWVDYHLFLSDATVACIQRLAHEVKKASEGRVLVAVSYGYTFEWAHPANGHLSLGKLLRTREVDIICGPPSYRDRNMGGAAAFPGPIDSFSLNNKLFISEEDFKTPISQGAEPDDFNPVMSTPQALEAAHWRGLGCALAHATGIAWMDLWGNGWLNTPAIWQRAKKVRDTLIAATATPMSDPDVAVLIDERSIAYLNDQRAFKQLIQDSREAILRAGVSAGFYLLSDLAHRIRFPDAKLYIFLNAWDTRPEVRAAIKNRLQRDGKTLFWVYAAGQFENGRPALERVREITGIAIRPQPFSSRAGTTILNRKHPLTELLEEKALSVVDQLEPSFFAIPEEGCTVLGEYTQTGLPSLVVREIKSEEDPSQVWRSVFLGEPLVNEKIIRGLCQLAGVQVWNYHGDVVHVRKPHLSIHFSGSGHRTATLPDRWHAYDVVSGEIVSADATHFRSTATDGETQVLLVGEEIEVNRLAEVNVDSLLTLDQVPEAEPDTLDDDTMHHELSLLTLSDADEFMVLFSDAPIDDEEEEDRYQPRGPRAKSGAKAAKKAAPPPKERKKPVRKQSKEADPGETKSTVGVRFRAKE